MDKIIGKRGFGKTTHLIRKCAESGDTIISMNNNNIYLIQRQAEFMELKIPRPITYKEFLNGDYVFRGENISGFLIDNIEVFLNSISKKIPVNAITMCP